MLLQPTPGDVDISRHALDRTTLDRLCQRLPRQDPVAAQQALCGLLSRHAADGGADAGRLSMLVALDGPARQTCERLLVRYVEGDAQLQLMQRRFYVAASRLSESMALAYDGVLRHGVRSGAAAPFERAADAVVRLLAFRQLEYLLRMFRYKKRYANQWRALNEAFAFAIEHGLHRQSVAVNPSEFLPVATTTAERLYIQLLLLGAVNGGQLAPREALWACRWFAHWCQSLSLTSGENGTASTGPLGFAVDLNGSEGPVRKAVAAGGGAWYLDTAPLSAMIDRQVALERDADATPNVRVDSTRHARLALLGKLRVLFAPAPVLVERRGQRMPVDSVSQVIPGLAQVVQALRGAAIPRVDASPAVAPLHEATIEAYGVPTRTRTRAAAPMPAPTPETWQVRDRSDSGCRLRGRTAELNRVIPGSLLAMRASDAMPWTLTVVRRVRRLMVDHVEIGVEYVGHNPRYVKIVTDQGRDPASGADGGAEPRCVGALYLPPSERFPSTPIRTLLLPAGCFRSNGTVTLLASNAVYTLRLNEPIEHQTDFVWTSFTILAKSNSLQAALH